jgi:gamma-glutamyltranspeptidase/glutathione hydrolase
MDPEAAAHHPRIDVSGPDHVSADRTLPAEVLAALRAGGALEEVQHGVMPINFACPNLIQRGTDGRVVGVADAASPWSGAVAA